MIPPVQGNDPPWISGPSEFVYVGKRLQCCLEARGEELEWRNRRVIPDSGESAGTIRNSG